MVLFRYPVPPPPRSISLSPQVSPHQPSPLHQPSAFLLRYPLISLPPAPPSAISLSPQVSSHQPSTSPSISHQPSSSGRYPLISLPPAPPSAISLLPQVSLPSLIQPHANITSCLSKVPRPSIGVEGEDMTCTSPLLNLNGFIRSFKSSSTGGGFKS